MKLVSSFSLGTLAALPVSVRVREIPQARVMRMLASGELEPSIGHPSLAEVLSERLKTKLDWKRETLAFAKGDKAVVAQIFGAKRSREGEVLPAAAIKKLKIKYLLLSVI